MPIHPTGRISYLALNILTLDFTNTIERDQQMFGLGMQELLIVGIVAVLLFGSRLPEVARNLGGSYREFRKGLSDLSSDMNDVYHSTTSPTPTSATYEDHDDYEEATAPKFEPPPSAPTEVAGSESADDDKA